MPLQVTALYAGLLGIIGIVLWGLVGRARVKAKISLNDGGIKPLVEANRRHMNWVENVPFILLLMAVAELNGGAKTWLHVMGGVLLISRLIHPFGICADNMMVWQRLVGATGTAIVAVAAIVTVLWQLVAR
jgi:uncharacterized membrane protein YecN with MAPEG domain